MLTRRIFLKDSALAMVGVGVAPAWLARAVYAAGSPGRKKTLVAIFQRGASDGLNVVAPFAEKDRKSTRLNSSHIQKSRMPSSA